MWAAPRGVGKSVVGVNLAVKLAVGGAFASRSLSPVCVLYLDRENPDEAINMRLEGWGADQAPNLILLSREDAPDLTQKEAWARFSVERFDVVIVDSVGSSTEGVTEKEGRETTQILATLRDLAARGVAILLINNTTKDGSTVRGRGEWSDRVDILYEVRDATGFTPSGKKPWWHELPAAGEKDWAERATRRQARTRYRTAFICSKMRLGPEPEPFCFDVYVPEGKPWSLRDVTHGLRDAGQQASSQAEFQLNVMSLSALHALTEAVRESMSVHRFRVTPVIIRGPRPLGYWQARQICSDPDTT